jgi:hypothetical protein
MLGHLSEVLQLNIKTEGGGFEPTFPLLEAGFQVRCLTKLGLALRTQIVNEQNIYL